MSRRIDPGNAVTAFVLAALVIVSAALYPKAKAPPPSPIEVLDSALQATFAPRVSSRFEPGQVLSITVWRDSIPDALHDSSYALAERIARYANAQYRGAPVEAISVWFYDLEPYGAVQRKKTTFAGAFLPPLLDGRVTPVTIDPQTFHAQTPSRPFIVSTNGPLTDSLVLDPATLRPIEEWYAYPGGSLHVTYNGAHISGSFDTTLAAAPFAAPELHAVLEALPLTPGYAARFPVYRLYGKGGEFRWQSIYVVGADSLHRYWRVNTTGVWPGFQHLEIPLKP